MYDRQLFWTAGFFIRCQLGNNLEVVPRKFVITSLYIAYKPACFSHGSPGRLSSRADYKRGPTAQSRSTPYGR